MLGLYVFAAIVGWALVMILLFFGDGDAEVELDGDGVADATAGGLQSLLSLRSIVIALAFFGTTGLALDLVGTGQVPTAALAVAVGVVAGWLNSKVWSLLRRTGVSTDTTNETFRGATGRVVIPVSDRGRGRVEVLLGDQPVFLVARPFQPEAGELGVGEAVVVVDVDEGTALVSRLDLPEPPLPRGG